MDTLRRLLPPLPPPLRPAFEAAVDANMAQLLPVLGPVCAVFVVLFGAWDVWIDPARADLTLRIRAAMVLAGAPAWSAGRLRWSAPWRCAWLYATHAGAMVVCAALLTRGLVLALPGLTGTMFMLALVEPRLPRFLAAATVPALALVLLGIRDLPPALLLNTLLLYGVSLALAACVAAANLGLRRQAFLAEQKVLYAFRHDSLSGALSRAYLTELALHDVALATRHGRSLAVAMLDIDYFKRVNDTHGHAVGDHALSALVATCRHSLRTSDYIGRVGGEEFVCVMPETSPDAAMACAERIRKDVAALRLPTGDGPLRFTVSIGVAALDAAHPQWDGLLRAADAALYTAKAGGRNRTVLAQPAAP